VEPGTSNIGTDTPQRQRFISLRAVDSSFRCLSYTEVERNDRPKVRDDLTWAKEFKSHHAKIVWRMVPTALCMGLAEEKRSVRNFGMNVVYLPGRLKPVQDCVTRKISSLDDTTIQVTSAFASINRICFLAVLIHSVGCSFERWSLMVFWNVGCWASRGSRLL
jgi:hypothetical protein